MYYTRFHQSISSTYNIGDVVLTSNTNIQVSGHAVFHKWRFVRDEKRR